MTARNVLAGAAGTVPRILVAQVLLGGGLGILSISGCSSVTSVASQVRTCVVRLATQTGAFVEGKARTFAEATRMAWRQIFTTWDGRVAVDAADPLRGVYRGELDFEQEIVHEGRVHGKMRAHLHDPPVKRATVSDHWELDLQVAETQSPTS